MRGVGSTSAQRITQLNAKGARSLQRGGTRHHRAVQEVVHLRRDGEVLGNGPAQAGVHQEVKMRQIVGVGVLNPGHKGVEQ
jgi:hypothetical protein